MGPSRVRHSQSGSAVQLARNTKTKLAADRNRLQPGGAGGGGTDVVERECEEQFLGVVRPARGGLPQVGVVAVGMGDRRTEDRWVGCRAGHAAVADQFDEAAVVEESRESVPSQMDTRAWRSRRRLTRGAMVVSSAYLLAAGSPARGRAGCRGRPAPPQGPAGGSGSAPGCARARPRRGTREPLTAAQLVGQDISRQGRKSHSKSQRGQTSGDTQRRQATVKPGQLSLGGCNCRGAGSGSPGCRQARPTAAPVGRDLLTHSSARPASRRWCR